MVSGWLIVDKPVGVSSRHVDNIVQRIAGQKKVGHAGTLDPLASGVLPIALGEATKVLPYMMDGTKTYVVEVAFGSQTSTDDSEGEVLEASTSIPNRDQVLEVMSEFKGGYEQIPPPI